jgi:hypothetical protein
MKIRIGSMTLLAVGCAALGLAQTPSSSAAGKAAAEITIVGCVSEASPSAAAPSGASASSAKEAKYSLTNAEKRGAGASTEATGTSGAAKTKSTYHLSGADAKLAPHVGHQVEIVAEEDTMASASSGTAGTTGSAAAPMTVKVKTVKMVSDKCTM